jgi:hypothetical protein
LPQEDPKSNKESLSNFPPTISPSTYCKPPALDFNVGSPSDASVPKKTKMISPFDDGNPQYDHEIFGFNLYDPLPACDGPFVKGLMSY